MTRKDTRKSFRVVAREGSPVRSRSALRRRSRRGRRDALGPRWVVQFLHDEEQPHARERAVVGPRGIAHPLFHRVPSLTVELDFHLVLLALHDAVVVGDTVGDPFKDTSSVALNPVIKFTTLFGLLAVELAVSVASENGQFGKNGLIISRVLSGIFFLVSMYFVWRSFHKMRIGAEN